MEEDAGVEAPAAAGRQGATARGRRRGGKVRSSGGGDLAREGERPEGNRWREAF